MKTQTAKTPGQAPGYRRKNAQQRRNELVDAGIHCLNNGGMSAFTIDNIHKQAAVSRGLLNHHFNGKEELLICIYQHMTAYLLELPDIETPADQLIALIEGNFDEVGNKQSNLRAWLSIWGEVATNSLLQSLHRERYGAYQQRVQNSIQAIVKTQGLSLDSRSIARQFIALIDGLWLQYCLHSEDFSLIDARADCYQFLEAQLGITSFPPPA